MSSLPLLQDFGRFSPRRHQLAAISAVVKELRHTDRAILKMACGTGKTLTSMWIAQHLAPKLLLVCAPTIALVDQLYREWKEARPWDDMAVMAVCSRNVGMQDEDSIVVDPSELEYPVSTDPETIRRFLDDARPGRVQIVLSTYDSVPRVAEALRDGMAFDLGVFDEAHNMAGKADKLHGFAIHDHNIPIKKRLFMTATPRLVDYDHLRSETEGDSETELFTMDDPEKFGRVAFEYSFAQAIRDGIICDYQIMPVVINPESMGAESIEDDFAVFHGKRIPIRTAMTCIAIKRAMEEKKLNKGFTFHSRIQDAQDLARYARVLIPDVDVAHINGSMSSKERASILKRMEKASSMIITNARCLAEGIDVPDVDFVSLVDPMRGKIGIVQSAGRALRKSHARPKEFGHIIIPVVGKGIRGDEDLGRAARHFQPIVTVLGALKDEGEDMNALFLAANDGSKDGGDLKSAAHKNFGRSLVVLKDDSLDGVSIRTLEEAITTHCVRRLFPDWEAQYTELQLYLNRYGRWPTHEDKRHQALHRWCSNQRAMRRAGSLSPERIRKLDEIGFPWRAKYANLLNEIAEYNDFIKEYGYIPGEAPNGHSPKDIFEQSTETRLVEWREKLRKRYVEGKLSEQAHKMLRERANIHFGQTDSEWLRSFSEFYSVLIKTGRRPSNRKGSSAAERRACTWIEEQVRLANEGLLPERRIDMLNSLGIARFYSEKQKRAKGPASWYARAEKVAAVKEQTFGRLPTTDSVAAPMRNLAKWINSQCEARDQGKLTPAQEEVLDDLVGDISRIDDFAMLTALRSFEPKNGISDEMLEIMLPWVRSVIGMRDTGCISETLLMRIEYREWSLMESLVNRKRKRRKASPNGQVRPAA